MTKNKYYVVTNGRQTGIFNSSGLATDQVVGYKGGTLKGFVTLEQAQQCAIWYGLPSNVVWTVYGTTIQKLHVAMPESFQEITPESFSDWINKNSQNFEAAKKAIAEIELRKKQEKERKIQEEKEKELKKKSKIKPIRYVLSENFELKKGTPLHIL